MRRLIVLACALMLSSTASAVPTEFAHQGRLHDALGDPLDGFNSVTFSLHTAPAGGAAVWAETHTLDFDNGYFSVSLGSSNALDPAAFDGDEMYLSIAVGGGSPLSNRIKLSSVPWSFWSLNADTATNVDGGVVNASEIQINGTTVIDGSGGVDANWSDLQGIPSGFADGTDDGLVPPTCTTGQSLQYNGSSWVCVIAGDHNLNVDLVNAGILDISHIPVGGSSTQVAAGNHVHNGIEGLTCAGGEVAKFDASTGAWACASSGGGGAGALLVNFELNDSSAPFIDDSGGGHDANPPGAGFAAGSSGHSGTSIKFSGGVITVGAGNSINDSPYITAEAWIRPDVPVSGDKTILLKEGAYLLRQTGDKIEFEVTGVNGSCSVTSVDAVAAGTWFHVQGTYNGRAVTVAVDGAVYETTCANGSLASTFGDPLHIGGDGTGSTVLEPYEGNVDEVRIWSMAPPSSEYFNGSPVLQTRVYSDYTRRSTSNGNYYYFGAPGQYDNVISPRKADSVIQIDISYFGEYTSHNNMCRLQYAINNGAWNNFDLANTGQQGTFKPGGYDDPDNDSTPDNRSVTVARSFGTTDSVSFRIYHFNGGTFYHNSSVNSAYESGPSTLTLTELNAAHSSYTKR